VLFHKIYGLIFKPFNTQDVIFSHKSLFSMSLWPLGFELWGPVCGVLC